MDVRGLTTIEQRVFIAMLDSRFVERTVAGIARDAKCTEQYAEGFLREHPHVFVMTDGVERQLWHIDRRCEGPNLQAARTYLFSTVGIFPIEAPICGNEQCAIHDRDED